MADRVPPAEVPWHALSVEEVLERLRTSPAGLSAWEADARLERFGPNTLPTRGGTTIWQLVVRQIASPLIYILLIAALISLLIGDPEDSYVILAVVLLNTLLGVTQEYRAERALAALRELTAPRARILRDGGSGRSPPPRSCRAISSCCARAIASPPTRASSPAAGCVSTNRP